MQDLSREEGCDKIPMCRSPEDNHEPGDETIIFERKPSMYFMLQRDTMLLLQLAGMKLKPAQQEWLYWNLLKLLNTLENEEKGVMTSPYNNGYIHKAPKKTETFDGGGYRIFWDEYNSIEQSHLPPSPSVVVPDSEDGLLSRDDKSEREIQWLSDVGFTNIAKKIRARHEIDQNDDEMKIITASLTRAQANAVRRRIDSLNEAIRQRDSNDKTPTGSNVSKQRRRHVKDIFGNNGTSNKKIQKDSSWIRHEKKEPLPDATEDVQKVDKPKSNTPPPPAIPPKPDFLTRKNYLTGRFSQERVPTTHDNIITNGDTNHVPTSNHVQSPNHETNIITNPSKDTLSIAKTPSPVTTPTPQTDNLVRRTSANNLIITAGEERDRLSMQPNNISRDVEEPNHFDFDTRIDHLSAQPKNSSWNTEEINRFDFDSPTDKDSPIMPRKANVKKRETFDSSSLRKPSDDYGVKLRQTKRSASHNIDFKSNHRRHSDIVNQEKRLVVVDSTYINISSVGDGYTTIKTSVPVDDEKPDFSQERTSDGYKVNDEKLHTKGDRTLESTFYQPDSSSSIEASVDIEKRNSRKDRTSDSAFYPSDNRSLQPYDMDALSDNLSDVSIKTSSDTTGPRSSSAEPPLTEPDGNVQSFSVGSGDSASPRRKNKDRKHRSKDPEKQHKNKERKKHKHRKNKEGLDKDDDQIPQFDVTLQKSDSLSPKSDTSLKPDTSLTSASSSIRKPDTSQLHRHSSSSNEMLNEQKETKPKVIYYTSSDSNRSTPDKSLESDLSSPRTQSPLCLEGDAKLNVGATTSSPRVQDRTPANDPLQAPIFPKLPNFTLTKEELGLTHIGDLSECDMENTRKIALLELTALFDNCSIPINQRKRKSQMKFKDNGTFGVPLTTLCSREESKQNPNILVPKIFLLLIDHLIKHGLHEEGILRIPGSAQRVKGLREEADKNWDLSTFDLNEKKITDVATCFKQFLRDLPEPLFTHEYQNTFTSVAEISDRKVQLQALNLLVVLLPPVHQETLKHLLVFLNKVVTNEQYNKMGLNNVAMIMAPNLFFQNNAKININEAQKAAGMTDVLRMLIKYQKILWTIPPFMVRQIRFIYDAGAKTKDPKTLNKIIKRRKLESHLKTPPRIVGSSGDELEDFEDSLIIRVKAPTLNKQSMAIQLSKQTTVSEVVSKFQWQRQKSNKKHDEIATNRLHIKPKPEHEQAYAELFLYEVGGNIGERRLDPEACIFAILRANPNAEWVLKSEIRR